MSLHLPDDFAAVITLSMNRVLPVACLLLAGCVSPPLYVGTPRSLTTPEQFAAAGPGYSGLIVNGVAHRDAGRLLTTGTEVPRDVNGNLITRPLEPSKPRHARKHWFGL